ncbi:MAG: SPOR domain-containing protein [Saprospiraceae bacterium]
MKSNSVLTYVLYGLLGLFILAAGYYACQKQKEKKELAAREAAELEETLRDMGYAAEDSIAASGSSYTNKDSLAKTTTSTKPTVSKTGIENETATNTKPTSTSTNKPSPTITKPKTSGTTKGTPAVKGPGTGRWAVRAGTFTYKEGARRRLEEVIKAGYPNAEISKTKEGLEAVIVFRSNNKDAAIRIVDQLELKGIDAAVFDRNK